MKLLNWDQLPCSMQSKEVKVYYDIIKKKRCALWIKRLFDLVVSSIMLILVSPILLVLSVMIKMDSEGPVFYRQERITTYGKTFRIFKFRTMVINADKIGALVTTGNDPRITKVGSKIRKYRLDELPQLINILFNQMSFIGPRPVLYTEIELIEEREKYFANSVYPGLTGLAQVNGRDTLNYKEKAKFDGIYANKITFLLDLKIFIKTIKIVLTKEGIIEGDSNNK